MNPTMTLTGLGSIANVVSSAIPERTADHAQAMKSNSLNEYASCTQVRPTMLVDSDVVHMPEMPDLATTALNTFTGYYLQAVAMSNVLSDVQVMRTLDKLNPNRDVSMGDTLMAAGTLGGWVVTTETFSDRLPHYGGIRTPHTSAMESYAEIRTAMGYAAESAVPDKAIATATEVSNLAVGKIFNVKITGAKGGKDGVPVIHDVPVAVRLNVVAMSSKAIATVMAPGSAPVTFGDRWHGWRSGQLEFVKDLILCNDLVDEHRKKLMSDKDGVFANISNKSKTNSLKGFLTANPSVATASNIAVISQTTADEIEIKSVLRFKNPTDRAKIFKETELILIYVVDKAHEFVTIYTRSVAENTRVSFQQLRSSGKGGGPDPMDVLKAYTLGQSPTL